jgi:hypothetical protein
MNRLITFLLFGIFFLVLSSCSDNREKAILNCADYDYVRYANLNPHLFITFDFTMVIEEAGRREMLLKQETQENKKKRKDLVAESKKKDKKNYFVGREEYYDAINRDLIEAINSLRSPEFESIKDKNLIKLEKNYKLKEFRYYRKFYRNCSEDFYSYKNESDKEKFLQVFKYPRVYDSSTFDISKLKERDKEKNAKLIKLLKAYSENELFIKQLSTN